jgi:hypothetical protein
MFIVAVVGVIVYLIARPDEEVARHTHDDAEPTGADRH